MASPRSFGIRHNTRGARRVIGQRASAGRVRSAFILLSCGCMPVYPYPFPVEGSQVWCKRCKSAALVWEPAAEWRIKCQDCRYSQYLGIAEITARTRATKHALKKGHVVAVVFGKKIVQLSGENKGQLSFDSLEEPPF